MWGRGVGGTVIAAIMLTQMVNGLNLLGVSSFVHSIVTGAVILVAVAFDLVMKKWTE